MGRGYDTTLEMAPKRTPKEISKPERIEISLLSKDPQRNEGKESRAENREKEAVENESKKNLPLEDSEYQREDSEYRRRLTEEILYWQEGDIRNWDEEGLAADGEPSPIFKEATEGESVEGPLFRGQHPSIDPEGITSWSEGIETPLSFALGNVIIQKPNGELILENMRKKERSSSSGEGENYALDDILDFSFLKEDETATILILRAGGAEHGIRLAERLEQVRGAWIDSHLEKLAQDLRNEDEPVLFDSESYNNALVRQEIVGLIQREYSPEKLRDLGVLRPTLEMPTAQFVSALESIEGKPLKIWNDYEKECLSDAKKWLLLWSGNHWKNEEEIILDASGIRDMETIRIDISRGAVSFADLVNRVQESL